jgi:cell wall-associated NlpC family hydrolase
LTVLAVALPLLLSPAQAALADRGAETQSRPRVEASATAPDDGLYVVEGRSVDYPAPPPPVGDAIAGFALAYVGYPYAAGGSGPYGFDCSGFARWVALNVLGVEIGGWLDAQPGAGAWVDYGAWLPGDLVFFQNTYRAGLSHVGIYLGDGLFIHAENEATGVVISSMYSSYYGPRYWGSVRLA